MSTSKFRTPPGFDSSEKEKLFQLWKWKFWVFVFCNFCKNKSRYSTNYGFFRQLQTGKTVAYSQDQCHTIYTFFNFPSHNDTWNKKVDVAGISSCSPISRWKLAIVESWQGVSWQFCSQTILIFFLFNLVSFIWLFQAQVELGQERPKVFWEAEASLWETKVSLREVRASLSDAQASLSEAQHLCERPNI